MNAPLYLTRQNADNPIFVPAQIARTLNSHDIDTIRHIYKFNRKNTNVVINTENGRNETKQINAFVTAVKTVPVLIICSDSEITKWEVEFEDNKRFNVVTLESATEMIPDQENTIVLSPHRILRRALHLREITWQIVVVQNIDSIIDLVGIHKLNAKFRIAITRYNFILNPNQQLYNKILMWCSNSKSVIHSGFYLPNQWLRLSWHETDEKINRDLPQLK